MKPITSKSDLIDALRDAAEIEHQLMVQYLYAGFSLKRDPDDGCSGAEYEHVRRWSSTLFMVARQEMEHLSFVSEMLTAIGATPHFARQNIGKAGLQSPYFTNATLGRDIGAGDPQPISLPYSFNRFDRATLERFICGESPPYADLPEGIDPGWCFSCNEDEAVGGDPVPLATVRHGSGDARGGEIAAGTVQELYFAIREAFQTLEVFDVPLRPEVHVPVEYNVFVFPVTDRQTAVAAIDLILTQGEGLEDPWNLDSHFRRFMEIRAELVDLQQRSGDRFDPAYPLIPNPHRDDIENGFTRRVFDATNEAYVVLLLSLASLYTHAVPPSQDAYPHLATALGQMVFAPMMPMIVRALNEVLVRLPIDGEGRGAGSNYFIGAADRALLEPHDADGSPDELGKISFLLDRWQGLTAAIEGLVEAAPSELERSLEFIRQNSHRIEANLRHIYQSGAYPKFVST
jgi:hypothetical protein